MTNAREDLFDRDLSKFLVQHSDIEADIREAFNYGGSVEVQFQRIRLFTRRRHGNFFKITGSSYRRQSGIVR